MDKDEMISLDKLKKYLYEQEHARYIENNHSEVDVQGFPEGFIALLDNRVNKIIEYIKNI